MKGGLHLSFIQKQVSIIKKNYKFLGADFNIMPSDRTVYAEYYDIRSLGVYPCVRVVYRNKQPISMSYCNIPIEFICENLKFGGF